ncbi:amino acid/amide ABC transporter membrane protein 2, HAAT family [Desulfomonile tiedjei DSM 6799]|uniref:Amino acid/amide ABC transporter membrane protein 2, HAAT family n=1 Tax=Desulfomonile tiedjei (strain ATCC 49306 / DSM 6799 / DCB-1) TaxID=706587 RepID=I4CCI6_DESTA|nr:amino acid/amide ABC transporter membrane protein 2, HAAT family [Desulfomonile tiedjei DSM 6799]
MTALLFALPFVLAQLGRTGEYWIWVTTEMIISALFAMSLNLILGYGGMVSFGHAAFFGVGAYTVALLMKKAGAPLYLALLAAPLVSAFAAAIIGWFCVRLIGLYFAILTLAFGQLLYMVAFQWYTFTGGDDGIHGVPRPEFLGPVNYYLLCLILFLVCLLIMRMIINSSFGLSIRSIRENMDRANFIGINVKKYQWINFIIAGAFAGLAGGLLAELNRFAQTEFLHWSKSAEPILASLVGGMYSILGPAIGSTVLIFLKIVLQQLHKSMVDLWAIILGGILLLVVLFAPGGLVGIYQRIFGRSES